MSAKKRWAENNRDKVIQARKKYYQLHKEEIQARRKKYVAEHPELIHQQRQRYNQRANEIHNIRYKNDPEYREKVKKRARDKHRSRQLKKFVDGVINGHNNKV